MPLLDELKIGQAASIQAIQGSDGIVQRLLEMGLFEGEAVEVIGIAPLVQSA